jgi:hypothetical protein
MSKHPSLLSFLVLLQINPYFQGLCHQRWVRSLGSSLKEAPTYTTLLDIHFFSLQNFLCLHSFINTIQGFQECGQLGDWCFDGINK